MRLHSFEQRRRAPPGGPIRHATARLFAMFLLAGGLLVAGGPILDAEARASAPHVVIIVGPVGDLTPAYRADAERAAAQARRFTDDVTTVYSPDATWPRVREALQGASVVVYLGHGNGFPSRYSRVLNRRSQNGLGLNPRAGGDDTAHQYFGEAALAEHVRLAPGAVVILSHLCYASGNSEPGLPEGSLAVAKQRVDNFAAGFLAAGAGAVVVDAFLQPAHYVRGLLAGSSSVERMWRTAPSFHDHVISFSSRRTPGARAYMDPTSERSGFYRSLVLATGAAEPITTGSAQGQAVPAAGLELVLPPQPSHAPDAFDLGAMPGTPTLAAMPTAGSTAELDLPVELPSGVALGPSYRLGTRWIPLEETIAPATPLVAEGGDVGTLVAPESPASLVEVAPATTRGTVVAASITLPAAMGRYRLEVTLHDADGVILPYAVQASVPDLVVHVGGPGAAWIDAPASFSVTAGTVASVQMLVTNGEARAWGPCDATQRRLGPDEGATCGAVSLVGRWIAVGEGGAAAPISGEVTIPASSAATEWLAGPVPAVPGTYLLVASLERAVGSDPPQVLGNPATIVVDVAAAPLVPDAAP